MKFCPDCGVAISEGAIFCAGCGKPLTSAETSKMRRWPFWLKWILITSIVLIAALMALGYLAGKREKQRETSQTARSEADSPIDIDMVSTNEALPMPYRPSYYISQFALGTTAESGLKPSADANGGSAVPGQGGPGLHKQ